MTNDFFLIVVTIRDVFPSGSTSLPNRHGRFILVLHLRSAGEEPGSSQHRGLQCQSDNTWTGKSHAFVFIDYVHSVSFLLFTSVFISFLHIYFQMISFLFSASLVFFPLCLFCLPLYSCLSSCLYERLTAKTSASLVYRMIFLILKIKQMYPIQELA